MLRWTLDPNNPNDPSNPSQPGKKDAEITYTIKKEKANGDFDVTKEKKFGKIGSFHYVRYRNPDSSIYKKTYNYHIIVVNPDKTKNQVVVTLSRKTYQVIFEVKNFPVSIIPRTIRHGATIGPIDESKFAQQGLSILKLELDGKVKTKQEVKNFIVKKAHKVTVYIGGSTKKFGQYPQTKVNNPIGIHHLKDELHKLKFNSKGKDYTMQFTRSYWQDSEGTKYEKYNGQYFKIEPVNFVKIPKQNTWFTEKIIDFSPFNLYYHGYPDNAKPEHSIFKAMVEDIGKVLGGEVHMPTYDTGDFQTKPALDASMYSQLKKEPTDYAKELLIQYDSKNVNIYRGSDFSSFSVSGVEPFVYTISNRKYWSLGTQYLNSDTLVFTIDSSGDLTRNDTLFVFGVVVCIR